MIQEAIGQQKREMGHVQVMQPFLDLGVLALLARSFRLGRSEMSMLLLLLEARDRLLGLVDWYDLVQLYASVPARCSSPCSHNLQRATPQWDAKTYSSARAVTAYSDTRYPRGMKY